MKILPKSGAVAKTFGYVVAWLFLSLCAQAQNFAGYDLIVPEGAPGTITVLDGTGKVLPTNRSYVIGLEGGTRGCIEFRNWTGTAEYPIVITNRPGNGRVTITDYTGSSTTPTYDGITLIHCRYLQLRGDNDPSYRYGIEIAKVGKQYVGRRGLHITGTSSYVEAMFLEIHHSEFAGIMAKQDPACGAGNEWTWHPTLAYEDIKLHDNYVHDVGGECFYIGYTAWDRATSCGAWGHEIHGLKIYNNLVERGGWDGIQVGSSPGAEIFNNMIVDSGTIVSADNGNTGVGVQIGAGTSGLFYNNTVINSRGTGVALYGVGDNYLFNNLIVGGTLGVFSDNRPNPIPVGQPADRQTQANAPYYFFNNTVVNPTIHGLWTMNEVSANYFKNNILIVPGDSTHEYIRYQYTTATPGGEAGNVTQRDFTGLNFVDPSSGAYDFRITGSSNARDAGVALAEVPVDFQGLVRPQGASYDAGLSEAGALSTYLVAVPPTVGNNNGSINASTIGGTPPYAYAWSHGPTTAALSNLAPGLYQVTVSDSAGGSTRQATYLFAGAEMGAPVALTLPGHVHAPVFSPVPGTYTSARSVTLTSATAGASIRYTLNGTVPTATTGTVYSGAIAVNSTATLKAIAYKSGMADSTLSVGAYLIGSPPAVLSGVAATVSDRRAYVTWNVMAGANRYEVRRATVTGGPYTLVAVTSAPRFTDYSLTNGATYYYLVRAASEYGTSADSTQVSATPAAYPATLEILTPVAAGTATGSSFCDAAGAFTEQPVWDNVAQKPAGVVSGAGAATNTGYVNRYWYIDFGSAYATLNITEMWTRYRWSSPGNHPGFGGFWWDDDINTVNNGLTETRMNFGNGQNVPSSGSERLWARDRDFGATPITPPKRYLMVSTGPTPPSRPDEFAFVGYRNAAPVILAQPQSQNVSAGASVTFTVSASGVPAPAFQWKKNAVNVPGATSASYTITTVQAGDAGNYSVVVTNSSGSVTSDDAVLTVASMGILTPVAWGQATGSAFCSAVGAFDEPPTSWNAVNNKPVGDSATPHSQTNTGYASRHWYVDFGTNYAKVRITQMWTRYRPNSPGSFAGFAAMWWDPNTDTVNDGAAANGAMNFATAQSLGNLGTQTWVRDADFTGAPITPLHRYLLISTGSTITSRPNEFTFVGYHVP